MLSRIKFEIEPLVEEILDQLPAEVWSSDTTTFLDPAIGGGQFVRAIERRLREAGHSDKNIFGRVHGYESTVLHVNFAVNKHNLIGNYGVYDFLLEEDFENPLLEFLEKDFGDMKFDVVVGNPPYNDGTKANNPIYQHFVSAMAKQQPEHFAFVIQANWLTQTNSFGKGIRDNLKDLGVYKIVLNGYDVFESAKVKTCTVFCQQGYDGNITLEDRDTKNSITIENFYDKILFVTNSKTLEILKKLKPSSESVWTTTNAYYSTKYGVSTSYVKNEFEKNPINQLKVTEPNKSGYRVFKEFKTKKEAEKHLSYYNSFWMSKLVRFVLLNTRTSTTIDNPQIAYVPRIACDRVWTDQEIYQHFNLSQEEIDHIEANVK